MSYGAFCLKPAWLRVLTHALFLNFGASRSRMILGNYMRNIGMSLSLLQNIVHQADNAN